MFDGIPTFNELRTRFASGMAHVCTILALTTLLAISSCNSHIDALPVTPMGEQTALENLAAAYRTQAENLPVSPVSMHPQARKTFIISVFTKAGYSYHKTLYALANLTPAQINQHHRDLAQLLKLPHHAVATDIKPALYSTEELNALDKIERW